MWSPRLQPCLLLNPHSYTPAVVPLLVLDLSIYQTRPCHSHLAGNLTINGLWYACLSTILSDLSCKMGSCCISWDFLVWSKWVDLGLHDSETLKTENFLSVCRSVYLNFTSGCEKKCDVLKLWVGLWVWNGTLFRSRSSFAVFYIQCLCLGSPSYLCQCAVDWVMSKMHASTDTECHICLCCTEHLFSWPYTFMNVIIPLCYIKSS